MGGSGRAGRRSAVEHGSRSLEWIGEPRHQRPPTAARATAARPAPRRASASSGSAPSPGSSRPCSASSRRLARSPPAARRVRRRPAGRAAAARDTAQVVGRAARAGQVQRVDEDRAIGLTDLLDDADGVGERPHREDRQELEHHDDAGRRRPLAQLAEALDDRSRGRPGRSPPARGGTPSSAATSTSASPGSWSRPRITGSMSSGVIPVARSRLDDGGRRRRRPCLRVEPDAGGAEAGCCGDVDGGGGSRSSTVPAASETSRSVRAPASSRLPVPLAQLALVDLAHRRPADGLDDVDRARALVAGEPLTAPGDQRVRRRADRQGRSARRAP